MGEVEIKKFSDLFVDYLEPGSTISDVKLVKLPPAGVGSVMVKAEVTVRTKDGSEEKLYVVVKLLPAGEMAREAFQIQYTFKNEVAFYKTIMPTLQDFQRQQGVTEVLDSFAKFYGARFSLDKDIVDDDAAFVLEDLVISGFQNITRQDGFNLEGAKLILRDLAKFQGTAIGLKLKEPELFNVKVKSTCRDFDFPTGLSWFADLVNAILKKNPDCAKLGEKMGPWPSKMPEPREPYASISHNDLWVNNTMQKIVNGKFVANKFVDFQVYNYRSCAADVFFFLWTSCQLNVLQVHLDYLLQHYHDNLVDTLKQLQCDTSNFSFDKFLEELRLESTYEFGHALFFAMLVKTENPIKGLDEETLTPENQLSGVSEKLKEHYYFMFEECNRKGWLH